MDEVFNTYKIEDIIEFSKSNKGRFRYYNGDNYIDFMWSPNGSMNLLVFFTAAVRRTSTFKLPAFSGMTSIGRVNANILMISDPSLVINEEIFLAWYAGSENFKCQPIIGEILYHLSNVFGCEKTVLYGGSAGGFASMYYSTYIPGAISVSANPQTNIINYYERLVLLYLNTCFPSIMDEDLRKRILNTGIDYEVISHFLKSQNKLIYMQNSSDHHHIKNHFRPFLKGLGIDYEEKKEVVEKISDRIHLVMGDWGKGHKAPTKSMIFGTIDLLFDKNSNIDSHEFTSLLESLYFDSKL